jgi:radical SAM superfamily enzyme YgiQ (UPF0313 family)
MRSPAVTKSGTLYYPMWLCYAAGLLEREGHDLLLLDAPARCTSLEEILNRVREFRPAFVLMDTSTPSIFNDIEVAGEIKTVAPDAFITLVGPHVSALPLETLGQSKYIDAVAVGEYDYTILELVNTLEKRGPLSSVKGIAYIKAGEAVINAKRDFIPDLDKLPFVSSVYRKHLNPADYFYGHSLHPLCVIITGRGCPFRCTFCVYPQTMHGHKYRFRSIDSVVEEFAYIYENFPGLREIMIEDDTFTADPDRCRAIAGRLIEKKLTRIPWSANSRADVDFKTMAVMRKAGCRLFCVGFESGDQSILDNIRKKTTLSAIRRFARDARRAGILVHGCFMVGNRGETRETLKKTLDFALELNPDTAQFFPIMVYPGTDDFEWVKAKGFLVSEDYSKWVTEEGLHNSVVSNPELNYQELVDFCDHARRVFYMRPSYFLKKLMQSVKNPREMGRNLKAFKTFIRHLARRPGHLSWRP